MIELSMLFIVVVTVYKILSAVIGTLIAVGLVVGAGLVIGHFVERRNNGTCKKM